MTKVKTANVGKIFQSKFIEIEGIDKEGNPITEFYKTKEVYMPDHLGDDWFNDNYIEIEE